MRITPLVCCALVLLLSAAAHAQSDPRALDDDELAADGWDFRERPSTPGSVGAGVLAITAGSVVHGAGHMALGDRPSWLRLLIGEAIGVVAFGAGTAVDATTDGDGGEVVGAALQTAGASMFIATWLADVVGAFKGTGTKLANNTREVSGLSLELFYSALVADGVEASNLATVSLPLVTRRLVVTPTVEADAALDYRHVTADVAWRQHFTWRPLTWVELAAVGVEEYIDSAGVGRNEVGARLGFSLDVGDVIPHVRGLVWRNHVGVSASWLYFDSDARRRFVGDQGLLRVPWGFRLDMNLNRSVNLGLGYEGPDDRLVGAASPRFGRAIGRVAVVPRNRIGVELRLEQGAFTRLWAGLRWQLVAGRAAAQRPGGTTEIR